jgi:hypothetical protein
LNTKHPSNDRENTIEFTNAADDSPSHTAVPANAWDTSLGSTKTMSAALRLILPPWSYQLLPSCSCAFCPNIARKPSMYMGHKDPAQTSDLLNEMAAKDGVSATEKHRLFLALLLALDLLRQARSNEVWKARQLLHTFSPQ